MDSFNKLTADEMIEEVTYAVREVGLDNAGSVAFSLIEKEAEKVSSDIKDNPKHKRTAELIYIRMVLDIMERAYEEEKQVHETGEEPRYDAGPPAG